ncbi:hypothetical protein OH76DRAFT_1559177 [Lentinus brumalis]|uniref:F-box domain-containing protein n=1 Tax=Lentinus brumalis TaxID=2498619 RepID=A0A371CYQ9_9APHY|nr:hypothetical protein OH76DRAFT_1559177 [Polyporus brumalis]
MELGTSIVEKVPPEVWLEIFKQVPKSGDLYSINVASHRFRDISTRALYRDLVWQNEEHAEQTLDVWEAHPGMAADVQSLCLGIGGEPAEEPSEIIDSIFNAGPRPQALANNLPATEQHPWTSRSWIQISPAQAVLWARVQTFINLSSLKFHNTTLGNGQFQLIHDLPQLRSLRTVGCTFNGPAGDALDNRTLPITELLMVAVHRGHQVTIITHGLQGIQPFTFRDPFAKALSLAVAENLRTLTVDGSSDIFRIVYGAPDAEVRGWLIPPRLEHLFILQRCTITATRRRNADGVVEEAFQDAHLYNFCAQARNLKTISTPVFTPSRVALLPEKLPPRLEAFAAPMDAAQFVAAHRDVKALGVLKCELERHEAVGALTLIAHARPGLKMLVFEVRAWDAAVVSAIAQNLKELRHLKFVYGSGGPDEQFIVSLSQYLAEMPDLHTIEMYRLPGRGDFKPEHPSHLFDSSWGSIEEELRDIVIPWNRFGRKLRRVQLISGYALTRAYEGATWKLEKVDQLKRIEYLDY